jgi:hypothetical protein
MNVPLGPDDGAVKVTETPLAGELFDITVTASGAANAVPTVTLCTVPLVAIVVAPAGTVFELELPQLVKKPMATQTKAAGMLE